MIQPSNSTRNSSKETALAFYAQLFINQSAVQLGAAPEVGYAASGELGRWTAKSPRRFGQLVAQS
ncbi:MAG: hypothetical protein JWQ90_3012 [Hydrocarboniphaga sp.]|nr:hypothetical protein [Hydrocarboniphaga sp.]